MIGPLSMQQQDPNKCPVCRERLNKPMMEVRRGSAYMFDCDGCGRFVFTDVALSTVRGLVNEREGRAKIAHALRRAQQSNSEPELSSSMLEEFVKRPLPSPTEQADFLIRWLAEKSTGPAEPVSLRLSAIAAVIGAKSDEGRAMIVDHLKSCGLIAETRPNGGGHIDLALTFAGWEHYEKLRRSGRISGKAFMAMKFGDTQLNALLQNVLKPAAKQAGFVLAKLDDNPKAGLIDDRIRVEIQSADFVVADLTHDNPGAYWEAGYAEGLGKPVIYTCESTKFEEHKTHFDTNHHLTVVWELGNQQLAGDLFKATIRSTLPHIAKQKDEDSDL